MSQGVLNTLLSHHAEDLDRIGPVSGGYVKALGTRDGERLPVEDPGGTHAQTVAAESLANAGDGAGNVESSGEIGDGERGRIRGPVQHDARPVIESDVQVQIGRAHV